MRAVIALCPIRTARCIRSGTQRPTGVLVVALSLLMTSHAAATGRGGSSTAGATAPRTAAPKTASAAADARLGWRVAPGIAMTALGDDAPVRRRWCDLGAHAHAAQPAPFAIDPIFHRPPEVLRGRMAVAIKQVELSRAGSDAERTATQRIITLMAGPEGPALARMALMQRGNRGRIAALRGALVLVAAHPRLAGFVANDLHAKEPARARAAVELSFAARCDTPGLYAMDGLDHASPNVREAVILGALRTAQTLDDRDLMGILAAHITKKEPTPRLRALYARGVGQAGWAPSTDAVRRLLADKSPIVRAEAAVALTRLTGAPPPEVQRLIAARAPASRISAIRALAAAHPAPSVVTALRGMLRDKRRATDPLATGRAEVHPWTVSDAAAEALAWHGAARHPTTQRQTQRRSQR